MFFLSGTGSVLRQKRRVANGNEFRLQPFDILSGASEGTRTPDLLITNQLLYQLSYAGAPKKRVDTQLNLAGQGSNHSETASTFLSCALCYKTRMLCISTEKQGKITTTEQIRKLSRHIIPSDQTLDQKTGGVARRHTGAQQVATSTICPGKRNTTFTILMNTTY